MADGPKSSRTQTKHTDTKPSKPTAMLSPKIVTPNALELSDSDFKFITEEIYDHTGIVLTEEKREMVHGRIRKRVKALKLKNFSEYFDYLAAHRSKEYSHFVNALTTNMTSFFREPHHFEYVINNIVPERTASTRADKELKIWSAGCSTGQEPYSIAISLSKSAIPPHWSASILATDIDTKVLNTGIQGEYNESRMNGLNTEDRQRYFSCSKPKSDNGAKITSQETTYIAKQTIKSYINFQQLNLMKPFGLQQKFDVIFCRNVAIYFDRETQLRLFNRFSKQLVDRGYLFIGHSETLGNDFDSFERVGETIYQKVK